MSRVLTIVFVGALLVAPRPAWGQIAFDASAESTAAAGSSSLTFSHTNTGSDRILWVCVGTGSSNAPTVTYNSVSMTEVGSVVDNSGYGTTMFALVAPATGANNVVITLGSGTNGIVGFSSSYTGAAQTGIPDSTNSGTKSDSTPLSVSTTTVADNSWVVGCSTGSANAAMSAGTATTMRNEASTSLPIQGGVFDSNGVVTPAGARALEVAPGATSFQSLRVASFAPVGGGGGGSFPAAILNNPVQCCGRKGR